MLDPGTGLTTVRRNREGVVPSGGPLGRTRTATCTVVDGELVEAEGTMLELPLPYSEAAEAGRTRVWPGDSGVERPLA